MMRSLLFSGALFLFAGKAFAQFAGGGVAMGTPHHFSTMKGLPGLITCCAGYNQAFGTSMEAHGLYRFNVGNDLWLQTLLTTSTENASFIANENVIMDGGGTAVDGIIRHTLSATMPWISADVLAITSAPGIPKLNIGLGGRLAYIMSTSYSQESRIIEPSNVRFENGSRVRNAESGEIPNHTVTFSSILGRLGWHISLPALVIEPHVLVEFGLTNLADGVTWKRNSYRGGIDVMFDLREIPEPEPAPMLPMPVTPALASRAPIEIPPQKLPVKQLVVPDGPPSIKLDMTVTGIDMYGDSVSADELKFRSVLSRVMAPMLPYIFHEEGGTEPASRYNFTSTGTQGFNLDTLARKAGILDIHYQSLNVIGERMRRHPEATLSIVGNGAGAGSEVDNIALATSRARWSRDYLVNTWGIDPTRLNTSANIVPSQPSNMRTPAGWAENRRTEFSSSTPEILEPFLIEDTVLSSNLALVKVQSPKALEGVEVDSWSIDVMQGNNILDTFSGKGSVPPEGVTWNLIDHRKLNVQDGIPVVMRLHVKTADGQDLEADKTLPTSVDFRLRDRLEQYNLVVFGYNSADLTEDHLRITNRVKKMLGNNVEIKIVGYADRTGNADYNRRLSARRAGAVADAIVIPRTMSGGVGFSDLLFDNTTPEGRFFCRTVRIFVKTNMK